jgi:hypothetical protein
MVEVYSDVPLRRCPITRSEAQAMSAEVKEPINPLMVLPAGQGVKAVDALVAFRGA